MKIYGTDFEGVLIIEPDVYEDFRGYFKETWNHEKYNVMCTRLVNNFVQDNESLSKRGVCRGMHWQTNPMAQSKLVRCIKGKIYDIVLCLIKDSPHFGKYGAFELSDKNHREIFIPKGYAHGFIAIDDENIVSYKVDNYWSKEHERCLNIDNLDLNSIDIPELSDLGELIISDKDKEGLNYEDLQDNDFFTSNDNILNKVKSELTK